MVEVLGASVPIGFGTGMTGIALWITIFCIIVLSLAVFGVAAYLIYLKKVYNKRIVVFENIAGAGWRKSFVDWGRLVKLGDGGEEVLFLLKKKVYRSAYGKKMDSNEYWFAIGQDGYWYNVVLGDLDSKMGILDIEPIDRDMRYMYVAIRKNIQDRYRKQSFMDKYGTHLFNAIFLVIMLVGVWLLVDKLIEAMNLINQTLKALPEIQQANREIVGALQNMCTASGVSSA